MRTLCTLALILFLAPAGLAVVYYVPSDFSTIQNAIDASEDYDRISVGEGVFVEQLIVDGKIVEIVGAGLQKTVISCPTYLGNTFSTDHSYKCIVGVINGGNLSLKSVTIDGRGVGLGNERFVGFGVRNAHATLQYCKIRDICETPMSVKEHGVAVYACNDDGMDRSVEIKNCNVRGYQTCGIVLNGENTLGLVETCTVLGEGPTDTVAQTGVQIAFNARGIIDGCTVSRHCYLGSDFTAVGLLLYHCPHVEVRNCPLIVNNQTGTYFVNTSGEFTNNVTLANVTAHGINGDYAGLSIDGQGPHGHQLQVNPFGDGQPGTGYFLNRVTITDSDFDADQSGLGTGIRAWAQEEFGLEISIINCLINDWPWGFEIWDDQFATPHPVLHVNVYQCEIHGSSTYGLANFSSSLINAFYNDWGDVTGPYHPDLNPGGEGCPVSSHVAFNPWITGEESLLANNYVMDAAVGGAVSFELDAGPLHGEKKYILLGSLTGTSPGTPLPGGHLILPLNWDPFTHLVLNWVNSPMFSGFLGELDASGLGKAELNIGATLTNFIGYKMYFAYALYNPFDFASNPVEILIAP